MRPFMRLLVLASSFLGFANSCHAQLTIIPNYDVSLSSLSNFSAIQSTINGALAEYSVRYADPITLHMTFKNLASGLGSNVTQTQTVDYADFRAALVAHATTADDFSVLSFLPSQPSSPVNGSVSVRMTVANAKVLGLFDGFTSNDSTISLNVSIMNVTRPPQNPSFYDLKAVAQHEIDEALGTFSGVDTGLPFSADHSRFGGVNTFSFTTSNTANAYFSVNGGTTNLANYNQSGNGDYGDWVVGIPARVQDFQATQGATPDLGVELRLLDVIGYHLITAVPEPSGLLLGGSAIVLGMIAWYRRRS